MRGYQTPDTAVWYATEAIGLAIEALAESEGTYTYAERFAEVRVIRGKGKFDVQLLDSPEGSYQVQVSVQVDGQKPKAWQCPIRCLDTLPVLNVAKNREAEHGQ